MKEREAHPTLTKHDFQRDRFQSYIQCITGIFELLKSGRHDELTNDELYNLVLKERYKVLLSDCLLLLDKIKNFDDHVGERLRGKGMTQIHQREERDVRDLRRNVQKSCDEFLRSLNTLEVPLQTLRGEKGLYTSGNLNKCLHSLEPFTRESGFNYSFRLIFRSLAHQINGAFTYKTKDVYDIDKISLARAFRLAAGSLEWALARHVAAKLNQSPG